MKKKFQVLLSPGNCIFLFYLLIATILFSSDIFSQWKVMNPKPFLDNCFIIYADSNNCNVLTRRANLVLSTDGGNSWNYHYPKMMARINLVYMLDQNNGWASGNSSTFKTSNGGYDWEDKGNILEFANWDIYFQDSLNGWSVGNGYIKHTTDGGEFWSTDTIFWNPQLQFITQYNDSVFFTGGYDSLYKSADGGYHWNSIPSPMGFSSYKKFISINSDSSTIGLLLGSGDRILKTTDEGNSWTVSFPNSNFSYISNMKYDYGLILTCGFDKVIKSTDFGETWDSVNVPPAYYNDIYFANDSVIYISGMNSALIKSTDGGNSFFSIEQNIV